MSDYYFSKFYHDVKDPAWPEMQNIAQFVLTAPDHIMAECRDQHNLEVHLDNLGSIDYFRRRNRHHSLGYKKHDLVFVPVLKCASSFFTNLFQNQFSGWQSVNLYDQDWSQIKAFGVLMEPSTRRIHGIMQILQVLYSLDDLERLIDTDQGWCRMLAMIPWLDTHSMPYSMMYGDLLTKINWIPMEIGQQNWVGKINNILVDEQIPYPCDLVNQSSDRVVQLRQKLTKIMMTPPNNEFQGAMAFAEDFRFYSDLLMRFRQP